jgi:hypothetical protein
VANRRAFAPTTVRSRPVCRLRSATVSANNGPNHFVSMLNIVDKVEFVLGKVLRSRHTNPPSARVSRRITASPHANSLGSSGLDCRNR